MTRAARAHRAARAASAAAALLAAAGVLAQQPPRRRRHRVQPRRTISRAYWVAIVTEDGAGG
jgi:hypothetical protein